MMPVSVRLSLPVRKLRKILMSTVALTGAQLVSVVTVNTSLLMRFPAMALVGSVIQTPTSRKLMVLRPELSFDSGRY